MAANKKNLALPIIVGIVLLAAAGYFAMGLLNSGGDQASSDDASGASQGGSKATTASTGATATLDVDKLLEEAKAAYQKGQFVSPEGANAVELYLRVLELEKDNRIARDALLEVMTFATDQTDQYIKSGNIPQAERALALLRRADPGSPYLLALSGNIERMRRLESTREAEQLAAQQALLDRQAQQTAQAQQTPDSAAETISPEPAPIAATPAAVTPRPRPTPPPVSAPVAAAPAPTVAAVEDRNFQLVNRVNPVYPQRALRQRIEGWVEMSFIVDTNGNVKNVSVVDAQPKRQFDREAMRALSQWKFRARIEGGKAVESSAKQRLEFRLSS